MNDIHKVKCTKCGQIFDRDAIPYIETGNRRYAHKVCPLPPNPKEEEDKEKLEAYIMKLFKIDYIDPRIRKQINQYINEYHYSYSGILKSLTYFYEIKGNSLDKANGGIGIVPYVYKNAYNYYFAIWEAQQKNEGKVIEEYKPKVKEVVIPIPKRKVRKRRLFAFLDEEDD